MDEGAMVATLNKDHRAVSSRFRRPVPPDRESDQRHSSIPGLIPSFRTSTRNPSRVGPAIGQYP